MSQRTSNQIAIPAHVAIIMDGNGRWATARSLPRAAGHRQGAQAVRRTVTAACRLGVSTLTLYAFSSDNWKRPGAEVSALMMLFRRYLVQEIEQCRREGIRLSVIGRRDRLPADLIPLIESAEQSTSAGNRLHLRLAVDYSSRDAILAAAEKARTREEMGALLGPDVDLLIRTAGEQRLSDYLLWECAYAEFHFTGQLWPDFNQASLEAAIGDFQNRVRRFGAVIHPKPAA
ncbi:MAG: di-trans,poly-cis-decaprenylcistransferase [Bryobacterales bacterium]|nr:di-trans,poly-cis-decaprenylcistransferase [Bryobacterales bacterium]